MLERFSDLELCVGSFIAAIVCLIILAAIKAHEKVLEKKREEKKKRLAEFPKKIPAALAKAKKATRACVATQSAASLAEAVFSKAGLDIKKLNFTDGPTEEEMLIKAKSDALEAIAGLGRMSVEAVKITRNAEYLNLRTYVRLAEAICEACDPSVGEAHCPALDILEKIDMA